MTPEIKAAAERFRCGYSGRLGSQQEYDDTRTLARAFVAEHPAGDDEPVSQSEIADAFRDTNATPLCEYPSMVMATLAIRSKRDLRLLIALERRSRSWDRESRTDDDEPVTLDWVESVVAKDEYLTCGQWAGEVQEMLCKDRQEYVERLDFFECRFNAGVARLRSTARRDICKDAAHLTPLVHDNESNEPHPEVERALSCITDSFDGLETDFLYRSKIHAAISSLPLDQRRVVELFLKEIPIDPQGTDKMTMVKILGCCEKTVRNRLKRAFARLAELLKEEDA